MKLGSLFSGIGALDLGLTRAGMELLWSVEKDPYCRAILEKRFREHASFDDVELVDHTLLDPIDVLAGGFPCQDLSVSNRTKTGLDGKRSGLWSEFHRLIDELQPRYVIIENVANLLREGMETVLDDLSKSGYDAEWQCFTAWMFGAIHKRERLFIVAHHPSDRVEGVFTDVSIETYRQKRESDQKALRFNIENPFRRSDRIPQSLIRRVDDGPSNRVERIRGIGNAVYVPIAEYVGHCVMEHSKGRGVQRETQQALF